MDAITRQVARTRRRKDETSERQKQEAIKQEEVQKRQRFDLALAKVEAAAAEAIERTTAGSIDWWARYGRVAKVCRVYGPHDDIRCWLHRKTVTLIWLPTSAPLFLGSDGRIYREGLTKTYRAELHRREKPGQIRKVAKVLDGLRTDQPPVPKKFVNDEYY